MSFLTLCLKSLLRNPIRSLLLFLSITTVFVLFGYLLSIDAAFSSGVKIAGEDRLIVINRRSLVEPLPERYVNEIRVIVGVKAVSRMGWLGAYYQDHRNTFPQIAVDVEEYLSMYPEFIMSEEGKRKWLADKQGAVIGKPLAKKYNLKAGDRITLTSGVWQVENSGFDWEFNIIEIATANKKGFDDGGLIFRYDYFDDNKAWNKGEVTWYHVQIEDPNETDLIIRYIDDKFKNSRVETRTSTERDWVKGVNNQIGNYKLVILVTTGTILAILSLMIGATISQSVKERQGELAVLFALGFKNYHLIFLIIVEYSILIVMASLLGLLISFSIIEIFGDPTGYFHNIYFPLSSFLYVVIAILALNILSTIIPIVKLIKTDKVAAIRGG